MRDDREYLDKKLKEYGESDVYPFHMPGHKRQDMEMGHPEQMDITEVDGFDNLHHAEGIIARAQQQMAKVFGADKSFFLVNGSTAGLLAAICAAVRKRGKILIARNCHKAVYHAIYLRELSVEYVYPMHTQWGIQGSINPEHIREKLKADDQIEAVLITSPTYDGVISDIEAISQVVHAHNIPLIVDEAHGAHFGFSDGFPQKALALGADVVIESMHKTLPAYTQSAALHLKGNRVREEEIQRFLGIFQSSSPSYLLMAGLARCTRIMEQQGPALMKDFEKRLEDFYKKTADLKYLCVFPMGKPCVFSCAGDASAENGCAAAGDKGRTADPWKSIYGKDNSKLLIFCQNANMSGQKLARILLESYGLQMEMDSGHYVTALTSLMDTQEGFDRLISALHEIDRAVESEHCAEKHGESSDAMCETENLSDQSVTGWQQCIQILYQPKEKRMEIATAKECKQETVALAEAAGRVSAEFAYLYPPGIPFLTPGEEIPENLIRKLHVLTAEGFEIQGLEDLSGKRIKVAT